MKPLLSTFAVAILLLGAIVARGQESGTTQFVVGQVWSYRARPIDDASVLVIVKVERDEKLGVIVHVAVARVFLHGVDGPAMTIAHMPFAEKALRQSVLEVLGTTTEPPAWESGYKSWRESFDLNAAGVYEITVAEAVTVTADSLKPK